MTTIGIKHFPECIRNKVAVHTKTDSILTFNMNIIQMNFIPHDRVRTAQKYEVPALKRAFYFIEF